MVNKKPKSQHSKFRGLASGVLGGVISGMILILLSPIFIVNEYMDQSLIWVIAAVIHITTTFIITLLCMRSSDILTAVAGDGVWLVVIMMCGIAIFDGPLKYTLVTFIGSAVGFVMALIIEYLLKNQRNRGGRYRKHKRIVHFNQ